MTDLVPFATTDPAPAGIDRPLDAWTLDVGVQATEPPESAGATPDDRAAQSLALRLPTRAERWPLLNLIGGVDVQPRRRPVIVTVDVTVPPVFRGGLKVTLPWNEQVGDPARATAVPFFPPLPLVPEAPLGTNDEPEAVPLPLGTDPVPPSGTVGSPLFCLPWASSDPMPP